ncbi:hypothetical protein NM688_g963 [Phlebia brevispora]|uniref:Uncharacterized protein n=1 Tax=Phlebia brevispora TaxID=194682 RepID=A0ACC1TCP8_9APHY|nr:hypothetical protein NM688_g963 [Phlebia brevispora]
MGSPLRTISLIASLGGAVLNVGLAVRVLASWRSLKWDLDGDSDALTVDAMWGLLVMYFAAATTASVIGFIGIVRNSLTYVRFFRDYSIADLMFMLMSAVTISYASFSSASLRAGVCEELGRQPELMRDMADSGLNLENCEYWFERAVVAVLGLIVMFVVIRVHFVIALSKYYNQLRRDVQGPRCLPSIRTAQSKVDSMQRIYLLPTPTSPTTTSFSQFDPKASDVLIYAPVPVGRISVEDAKEMHATEAWVPSPTSPRDKSHRHHHRHHSHSYSNSSIVSNGRPHKHHRNCASVPYVQVPYRDDVAEPLLEDPKENEQF